MGKCAYLEVPAMGSVRSSAKPLQATKLELGASNPENSTIELSIEVEMLSE
jgi:hypothetical protein